MSHLRPGSRIVEDARNVGVDNTRFHVDYVFDPRVDYRLHPSEHAVVDYQRAGYQYLIVNTSWSAYFTFSPGRFPDAGTFYADVACRTLLIAVFDHDSLRHGPPVRIYSLEDRPRRTFGPRCDQHPANRV